jgi:hypothetical protein
VRTRNSEGALAVEKPWPCLMLTLILPLVQGGRVIYSGKATPRRGRINTQAGPAARQAGEEVKRERVRICPTACISRVSRFERSEGMRLASAEHPASLGSLLRERRRGFQLLLGAALRIVAVVSTAGGTYTPQVPP